MSQHSSENADMSWFQRILRSSLTHFLIVGGVLFALAPASEDKNVLVISKPELEMHHKAQLERLGVVALSPEQRREVDQRVVHDALLAREAKRLGLDAKDDIVKQRLVQKMLFLAAHLGGASQTPTEQELRAFYQKYPKRWEQPAHMALMHVFVAQKEQTRMAQLLTQVQEFSKRWPRRVPDVGDTFPLPRELPLTSLPKLKALYGAPFVQSILAIPLRQWSAPIRSHYGWHLVRVLQTQAPRMARFEEVRDELQSRFIRERKQQITQAFLRKLYSRYTLRVEGYAAPPFRPK